MNAVAHCPAFCLKWIDFPPLRGFSVGGLPAYSCSLSVFSGTCSCWESCFIQDHRACMQWPIIARVEMLCFLLQFRKSLKGHPRFLYAFSCPLDWDYIVAHLPSLTTPTFFIPFCRCWSWKYFLINLLRSNICLRICFPENPIYNTHNLLRMCIFSEVNLFLFFQVFI